MRLRVGKNTVVVWFLLLSTTNMNLIVVNVRAGARGADWKSEANSFFLSVNHEKLWVNVSLCVYLNGVRFDRENLCTWRRLFFVYDSLFFSCSLDLAAETTTATAQEKRRSSLAMAAFMIYLHWSTGIKKKSHQTNERAKTEERKPKRL